MKVFVYGSLKKGRGNYSVLEESNAKFIAECELVATTMSMYDLGYFPAVVNVQNFSSPIKGELYEVSDLTLLDYLEGYPDLYYREEVAISEGSTAWLYLMKYDPHKHDEDNLMPGGLW